MKRQIVVLLLVLGAAYAASAQNSSPDTQAVNHNVAAEFSASPAASTYSPKPVLADGLASSSNAALAPTFAMPLGAAAPDASPAPDPKFLYGGRDDFRWQLGIGADWIRFRSSIFNASAVGIKTSVTYFTNDWFGIEGNISAAFAPEIFAKEHVKVLVYGAGPKIAWRQRKWEPWLHAILGGAHEQPQTADNSKNSFAVELGGGTDYRFNPRLSGRLEANWIHTSFFSQSQNNFELMGGIVFHF